MTSDDHDSDEPGLRRELTSVTLSLYGIGVMVGAGIYVLIGEIVGVVGAAAWLAFLLASVAALPTGLSYAELASRHPHSAGEAVYTERAFAKPALTFVVGFLVFASGVASTAAVSHGFVAYVGELLTLPELARAPLIAGFLLILTLVNHRGIRESTQVNVALTVTSVGALILLVILGIPHWSTATLLDIGIEPVTTTSPATLVLSAAALAFYAFIGFEDICNVADEVREPTRAIPRAIGISLATTTLIYVGVAITIVCVVPPSETAEAAAPLVELSRRLLPGVPPGWLALVALFAVSNTALFNLIMGSRILWGMGREGLLPPAFTRVHQDRQTPTVGIVVTGALTLVFSLTGMLQVLAESTNTIILAVFFAVNLALVVIRVRDIPAESEDHFRVPLVVPIIGLVTTGYLLTQFSAGAYLRAGGLLAVGVLTYAVTRWLVRTEPEG